MEPNIAPFSVTDLTNLLSSDDFCSRLTLIADFNLNLNFEVGFSVARNIYDNTLIYPDEKYILPSEESEFTSLNTFSQTSTFGGWRKGIDEASRRRKLSIEEGEIYPVLAIHIHPFTSEVTPSPEDFESLSYMRRNMYDGNIGYKINVKPIMAIAHLLLEKRKHKNADRKLELLVVQEASDNPLRIENGEPFCQR